MLLLEEEQKLNESTEEAERRIAEFRRRVGEGLDRQDFDGKRDMFAAFDVKVTATKDRV